MRLWNPLLIAALCLMPVISTASADDVTSITLPDTDEGLPGAGPIRRYDWFKGLWNERRAAWAKSVQQDQKAVVFLGDSITQGWGDHLQGAFPGIIQTLSATRNGLARCGLSSQLSDSSKRKPKTFSPSPVLSASSTVKTSPAGDSV